MKVKEDLGEEVMEKHVLIENRYVDHICTTIENQELVEAREDNIVFFSHTIQVKDMDIVRLRLELKKYRKQRTAYIIHILPFDNVFVCSQVVKEEIHAIKSKLFTKVVEFMDFFKFQAYVE